MSAITVQHICAAAKGRVNESNLASVLVALDRYGGRSGGVLRTRSLTVQIARSAAFLLPIGQTLPPKQ